MPINISANQNQPATPPTPNKFLPKPGTPQMPWGTARDGYIKALDAHMRAQFAADVNAFEWAGDCQIRVIGVHAIEGEHWAPGLLFNYRLPGGPAKEDGPHFFRQWAFRMDLPEVTSIDLFAPAMEKVTPRFPKIRQTLIDLHQTLGYIDSPYNEDAFESHIREEFAALTDPLGMQFLLCPVNGAVHQHMRLEQGTPPVTDGAMEDWIAEWCAYAEELKEFGAPKLTRKFLASLRRADADGNWFTSHGGRMLLISPRLVQIRGGHALVLEMPMKHHLPMFDKQSRFQVTGCQWFSRGRLVVNARMLGMEPGYFMAAINAGTNPLLVQRSGEIELVTAAAGIEFDFNP